MLIASSMKVANLADPAEIVLKIIRFADWAEFVRMFCGVADPAEFLISALDTSELYLFEIANRNAHPIFAYCFPNALSLTGIAEVTPDVFAVIAGNHTLSSGPTPGSWTVWRLDLNGCDPEASTPGDFPVFKITDVPEAAHLNSKR